LTAHRTRTTKSVRAFALVALAVAASSAAAADLTLLCAGAMRPAISKLLVGRAAGAPRVDVTYATAGVIRERLAKGERPDLVIVPGGDALELTKQGLLDASTRHALGETEIGVAVRAGSPLPDIGTPDALRATLLAARRVVIVDPNNGTSGRLMIGLFQSLGIEDQLRGKLMRIDGGMVVEAVARGEADLGFQQVSEILPVAGVQLVGTLPGPLKKVTRYDVAVLAASPNATDARAFAEEMTSPRARAVIEQSGFTAAR